MGALPQWLAKTFELSSDGIVVIDGAHEIVSANRSWLAMHGFEPSDVAELVGSPLKNFHVPSEIQRELVPFLDRLERAGSAQGPLGQIRADGEAFQTWTTAARVESDERERQQAGEPATYVLLCRDLSAERTAATALKRTAGLREEAEARLLLAREAVRVRDEFLSVAAHQLNNPLGAALLHAQVLVRQIREYDGRLSASTTRHIESLHRVLVRMTTLVSELLDVSKIEAGRVDLQPEAFDLGDLVRETADTFVDQLGTSGSELRILADGSVLGSWDRLRLGEVVANLLSNAIKYGDGKPVEVTVTSPDEGRARLTVADHGPGMSLEDQRHVFQRFERGDAGRAFPGSGLGLWIAHQMILAHEGSIRVASAPGEGATFIVELPLHPQQLRASETRSAAECHKTAT